MKNARIILAVITFVSAFVFSVGLVRLLVSSSDVAFTFKSQPKTALASEIESFIQQDIRHGQERNERIRLQSDKKKCFHSADYTDAVMDYWKSSSGMNAQQFPQDFQQAWQDHMDAWGDYASFLAEHKNFSTRGKITKEEFLEKEKSLNDEINRTWDELLRIGRSYGADVW